LPVAVYNLLRIAIAGVGNCASSLIQGIYYYRDKQPEDAIGLMHWDIGGFTPGNIQVVAAFDIDKRKVGKDVSEAIFSGSNCTWVFCPNLPKTGVQVQIGRILDSFSEHMKEYEDRYTFVLAAEPEPGKTEVTKILRDTQTDILLNYMPVGSDEAARFYVECALDAGVAIDALRCAKLTLDCGLGGVLEAPSAYFRKQPPRHFTDDEAYHMIETFIKEFRDNVHEMSDYRRRKGQGIAAKE